MTLAAAVGLSADGSADGLEALQRSLAVWPARALWATTLAVASALGVAVDGAGSLRDAPAFVMHPLA